MEIAQKLKILVLLKKEEKVACLPKKFQVNESTIHSNRDNENNIRQSVFQFCNQAKVCKISREGKK